MTNVYAFSTKIKYTQRTVRIINLFYRVWIYALVPMEPLSVGRVGRVQKELIVTKDRILAISVQTALPKI